MNFQLNKGLICRFIGVKTDRPQVEWYLNYDLIDTPSISTRNLAPWKKICANIRLNAECNNENNNSKKR